jgi:2-polyprenyl-3-methyl-5-hydroxy-6-metoxy-1,4-benzoquinol methylase
MKCSYCNNETANKIIEAKELLLGIGGSFKYNYCNECNGLELIDVPADMSKYYPQQDYYSFKTNEGDLENINSLKNKIRKAKAEYLLFNKKSITGVLTSIGYKMPDYYTWLKKANVDFDSAILDVGCGNGDLLFKIRKLGFKKLTGVDPFISSESIGKEVSLLKKTIFDLQSQYDFVMSHHSFEHMEGPQSHLIQLAELIKEDGTLLIRTPVTNSFCWEKYGVYWAALDAPRHINIQSHRSMEILAKNAGLTITDLWHDASSFQFWGSEEYLKGINSTSERSVWKTKINSTFTKEELNKFRKDIAKLNKEKLGGEACFVMQKR